MISSKEGKVGGEESWLRRWEWANGIKPRQALDMAVHLYRARSGNLQEQVVGKQVSSWVWVIITGNAFIIACASLFDWRWQTVMIDLLPAGYTTYVKVCS